MQCPQCNGELSTKGGHGEWCPDPTCKWGWEIELDGSPLKPPIRITRILKDGFWIPVPDKFEFDIRGVDGIEIVETLTRKEIEEKYGKV